MIRYAELKDADFLMNHDTHIKKAELMDSINKKRIFVAEKDHQLIGWLRYNLFWDNTPFMNLLYVLEEFRDQSYGSQLVDTWEKEMKEQGYQIVMTSTVSNETAQFYYQKKGYQNIGGFTLKDEPYEIIFSKSLE